MANCEGCPLLQAITADFGDKSVIEFSNCTEEDCPITKVIATDKGPKHFGRLQLEVFPKSTDETGAFCSRIPALRTSKALGIEISAVPPERIFPIPKGPKKPSPFA